MFYLNVWLTVQDKANIETVRTLMAECRRLSLAEPGCVRYEVYHSEADTTRFLLCEHWADKAAWEKHRTGQAFVEVYGPKVIPLVVREPHISQQIQ